MKDKKNKILLIEDDPFLIDLYSAKFKKEGFSLSVADDEREGFEKAIIDKPQAIVLDISLPEHEDFGLLKKMKENDKTKHIPIIILSDLENKEEIDEALSLGARDYLIRSQVVFEDLIDKVNNIIKES